MCVTSELNRHLATFETFIQLQRKNMVMKFMESIIPCVYLEFRLGDSAISFEGEEIKRMPHAVLHTIQKLCHFPPALFKKYAQIISVHIKVLSFTATR